LAHGGHHDGGVASPGDNGKHCQFLQLHHMSLLENPAVAQRKMGTESVDVA
jgi:hypothetical protein